MMARPRHLLAVLTLACASALTACTADSEDSEGAETPSESQETPADGATESPEPEDGDQDESTSSGEVFGFEATEAAPGTWEVGEAGTVSFEVTDGALVLGEVVPNDGWQVTDVDEAPGEIEVDFEQGETEIEIEIELSSTGVLEIEIDTDVDPAEPGTYQVGDAGEFTFSFEGGALELTDLTVTGDWQVTDRDEEADEIEFDLRNGAARWDVEVELDDGTPELELDWEVSSQL